MKTLKAYPEYAPVAYQNSLFSISELYHENTKHRHCATQDMSPEKSDVGNHVLKRMTQAFKAYPAAPTIPLCREFAVQSNTLIEVIQQRRSIREYSDHPLELDALSRLLYLANGITAVTGSSGLLQPLRAVPSAGALYPIEIYPIAFNVRDLETGIYHYNVRQHVLESISVGDFRAFFYEATLRQTLVQKAAALFVLTGVFPRTTSKYGERGYRYALLDAGHIGQNLYLVATAMGLGVVSIGGFYDDDIHDLLRLDGVREAAVYLVVVGALPDR